MPAEPGDAPACLPDQDLLRRRRRLPGGHALHGHPPERRRHAVPVPPGLRGNASRASLADLWTSSELFAGIRERAALGGRCGACELNATAAAAAPAPTA